MVVHEDLVRLWGEGNVVRYDPSRVDVALPANAADALENVGLPKAVDPLFEVRDLSILESRDQGRLYCRFGTDHGTDLCVALDDGAVMSLSVAGDYPDRFVNTSLPAFIEFLLLVSDARRRFLDLGDDEIDLLIADLETRLRRLDDRALADPDDWWSVIIEQMKDGLL